MPTRRPIAGHASDALEERVNAIDREVIGRFSIVDREIAGIKSDVGGLGDKIDSLVTAIGASRATNWQPIWSAASVALAVVIAVGTLAWVPVTKDIGEIKEVLTSDFSSRYELLVPRREMEQRWARTDKELAFLQKEIDSLAERFGNTYTVRDAFEDLTKRIDRIQDIVTVPLRNDRREVE